MRTVSETLLAAQRAHPQRPRVRLLVRDKQARFTLIGRQSTANVQSSACLAGDSATIVIAALDTSGNVRVRRVTDPSILDPTGGPGVGWGFYTLDYTTIVSAAALAWPDGDVCISENGGTLRVFYVNAAGTAIYCKESTDNGATWGSAVLVRTVTGGATGYKYQLASAGNNDLWYTIGRSGYRYIYMGVYSGGVWGSWTHVQYLMETGGEYENCYGLAALYDATPGKYQVVAALDRAANGDGRVVSALWDAGTATVSEYQGIVPPGVPMAGFAPWSPALLKTSDALGPLWVLTYWDTFTSTATGSPTVTWTTPMCILSRDFDHWSYKVPLGFTSTTNLKRISPVELSSVVYLHCINEAYKLDLWYDGKSTMELTAQHGAVLRYRINERPEAGQLHIELDNRGGAYDNPGVAGYTAAPLRPLASLYIDQGLNTAAGDERVESRPFYLWSTSQVRAEGVNLTRLYGVDGWQLLRMWRPDCTIQWEGKTLGWCIAEMAARVGFWYVQFDDSSQWDQVLRYFTVSATYNDEYERWHMRAYGRWMAVDEPAVVFAPHMNGITILHHLLNLVGGTARFGHADQRDVLYCYIAAQQGPSPAAAHTYQDGEILAEQFVDGFAWPTRVRVTGNGVAYQAISLANALAVGMDFFQVIYASQWSTAEQLQDVAAGALDDADARAWAGWLQARPNVGLELGDVIVWNDSKCGAGLTSVKRRVNGILTEYEPSRAVWRQTIYVEGV